MSGMLSVLVGGIACTAIAVFVLRRVWYTLFLAYNGVRDPPGPRPSFLLGNLLDIPKREAHLGYSRLADQYGTLICASWDLLTWLMSLRPGHAIQAPDPKHPRHQQLQGRD